MRDFFQNNLALLNEKIPEIGSLLKSNFSENKYRIFPSKSGIPALSIIHPDGTNRTLHSQYDPIQEATRFIETCLASETSNYIIIGLGLGYHLHELIKIVSNNARIIVIEKNPSLARLAFTYNDFSSVINHPGISFHIGVDPGDLENILNDDRTNLAIYGYTPINFKPLVDSEEAYYKNINNELVKVHQNFQIDINTQAAFSKKFYKNIFKNGQSIINSPGIKAFENIFRGIPAILVSAGPSLDKNVNLIKSVRKNIVIISVATALKPLINNGVIPDFVVAIDPNENTLQSFNIETIPKNLWLIYDPCVPSTVISLFKGRSVSVGSKVSLAAWLMKHNNNAETLGNIFSVSHSAFHISCLIGCNPIILVGQDLSFDGHRMHCSDSFYNQMNQDMISSGRTLKLLEYNKYREYSPALVPALNIFDKFSNTTKAMDTYRYQFINEKHKNLKILNATEGGVNIPGTKNMALR